MWKMKRNMQKWLMVARFIKKNAVKDFRFSYFMVMTAVAAFFQNKYLFLNSFIQYI